MRWRKRLLFFRIWIPLEYSSFLPVSSPFKFSSFFHADQGPLPPLLIHLLIPSHSYKKNLNFPFVLLHNSSSFSSSDSRTPTMALTLHSPASFLTRSGTYKPNKASEADPQANSVGFGPFSVGRRLLPKIFAASHHHEAVVPEVTEAAERLHRQGGPGCGASREGCSGRVPVFVMLPLDAIGMCGGLTRARAMEVSMMALRNAGAEGVMVDVWWGVVERAGPGRYDWEAYAELVRMAERHGLKLQMVMSFHQCGGNVGDSCNIPLPPWVIEEISRNPDIVFTDRSGRRNPEYISLGCDTLPVLHGRTPIQVYSDYMLSFRDRFKDYLGNVIDEIQVGMGPCGELRYPSYPERDGTWKYPGIGEFQCYDKYMLASLKAAAVNHGHEEWGRSGPHDSGQYNQFPEETGFFKGEGTWNSEYGKFFLEWYSSMLLEHGDRILSAAEGIFRGTGAKLSAKVAGIHWHYKTCSHAAELTAGYYNTRHRNGYLPIARLLAKRGAVLNFTCMEMRDEQQPWHINCSPEMLVRQVKEAAKEASTELAGENALERYDEQAYSQVLGTSRSDEKIGLSSFTYLRMNKRLFEEENWRQFVAFVKSMGEGGRRVSLPRSDSVSSGLSVGFIVGDTRKKDKSFASL